MSRSGLTARRRLRATGFTLLEILVVLTLIALIMSVAVPAATMALKVNLNNSTRELATTIRAAYDEAVLRGQVHRVAFDIEKGQYWVEVGDRDFLIRSAEQEAAERRRLERMSEEERAKHQDPFTLARGVTRKKQSLPTGVHFTEIMTAQSRDPLRGGTAYAHVFPHGFMEKLVLHLKDDYDRESTLIINPVTGKSRLFDRYVREVE